MYDDLFKEDMETLLRTFARKTKEKRQIWNCIEYEPIMLISDFDRPGNAYISHSFTVNTYHNDRLFELMLMEEIYLPSEKGNISGSLSFENEFGPKEYEFSLSFNSAYDECNPENILSHFADSPIISLANELVPVIAKSEEVAFGFSYARLDMQSGLEKFTKLPLVQLAKKTLERKDALTFHMITLDVEYRNKLLQNMDAYK